MVQTQPDDFAPSERSALTQAPIRPGKELRSVKEELASGASMSTQATGVVSLTRTAKEEISHVSIRSGELGVCVKGELLQDTDMFTSSDQIVPMVKRDLDGPVESLTPKVELFSGSTVLRSSADGAGFNLEGSSNISADVGVVDFVAVPCKRETHRRLNLLRNGEPIRVD